jgi:hypothetical protein
MMMDTRQDDIRTAEAAAVDESGRTDEQSTEWIDRTDGTDRTDRADRADETDRADRTDGELAADLWDNKAAEELRARWHEVQVTFVDNPKAAAEQAETLVDEAARQLSEALSAHRSQAASTWRSSNGEGDTERLRQAVQRYRDVFDRLLAI